MKARNVVQNEENKSIFKNIVLPYLMGDEAVTKKELKDLTNLNDRAIRNNISLCSMFYPVLATSDQCGYRIAKNIEDLSKEELKHEIERVKHQLNEIECRKQVLSKKEKPLIAYLVVAERELEKWN